MVDLQAVPAIVERTDPLGNKIKLGAIGVETTEAVGNFRRIEYGPLESVAQAVMETGYIIGRTGEFFQRFAVGREDKCQLGGPVKIANMAGKAASQGFDWLIQLMAMLSVGIGLLNLFPLPPLDGGHLVFYAVEAIKAVRCLPRRRIFSIVPGSYLLWDSWGGSYFSTTCLPAR